MKHLSTGCHVITAFFLVREKRVFTIAVKVAVKLSFVVFGEALLPLWNGAERMEREKTCPNYPK
jgi:hypothetical protein